MKEAFRLNNLLVMPGQKLEAELLLMEGAVSLPVCILNGVQEGETVLVFAGIHASEHAGMRAAMELCSRLEAERVRGCIVIVKAVNRAFFESRGTVSPDQKNLNRVFPGSGTGSDTEQFAFCLSRELIAGCDRFIDLHGADLWEEVQPFVYYPGSAPEQTVASSRRMARMSDMPYMVRSDVRMGSAYNYAASLGIPSIQLNRGRAMDVSFRDAKDSCQDVLNILIECGAYAGVRNPRQSFAIDLEQVVYQNAQEGGLWFPRVKTGDLVAGGDLLGEIRDYEGRVLEEAVADFSGVVLFLTGSFFVPADSPLIAYGKIAKEQDERKERVLRYWGLRSEAFASLKERELHSVQAERWLKELNRFIPEGKRLKILDVGCGAGFFSILLAREGHLLTGIDLTREMIERARALAEKEGVSASFLVMDAEKPDFPDESFDLVISRNLTWTLPYPEKAYHEWCRLLKKNGTIVNFDANYGLEDFEKNEDLPGDHAHSALDRQMLKECEAIKRQMPVSFVSRPAWDLECLSGEGLGRISVDLELSRRIYLEKDEFYNPAPMFVISGVKTV